MDEYRKVYIMLIKYILPLATSIIYYIYKYKHLHLASFKYLQKNFRYQWTW